VASVSSLGSSSLLPLPSRHLYYFILLSSEFFHANFSRLVTENPPFSDWSSSVYPSPAPFSTPLLLRANFDVHDDVVAGFSCALTRLVFLFPLINERARGNTLVSTTSLFSSDIDVSNRDKRDECRENKKSPPLLPSSTRSVAVNRAAARSPLKSRDRAIVCASREKGEGRQVRNTVLLRVRRTSLARESSPSSRDRVGLFFRTSNARFVPASPRETNWLRQREGKERGRVEYEQRWV
jgi:hypothetical protein